MGVCWKKRFNTASKRSFFNKNWLKTVHRNLKNYEIEFLSILTYVILIQTLGGLLHAEVNATEWVDQQAEAVD